MNKEALLWTARPSQVLNTSAFFWLGLTSFLIFPVVIIAWKWLVIRCTDYKVTSHRVTISSGVLNKQHDELELYRVKDYRIESPLLLRLFSLSNLHLVTSDRITPLVVLYGIKEGDERLRALRRHVEIRRIELGVREFD